MKNSGLQFKILLLKCWSPLHKILVLGNQCKIMVPLFGAASQFYTDLGLKKQC